MVTGQLQDKMAVYVAAGGQHTLCTTADGSLFSWGFNGSGQLGVKDGVPLLTREQEEQETRTRSKYLRVLAESHTL